MSVCPLSSMNSVVRNSYWKRRLAKIIKQSKLKRVEARRSRRMQRAARLHLPAILNIMKVLTAFLRLVRKYPLDPYDDSHSSIDCFGCRKVGIKKTFSRIALFYVHAQTCMYINMNIRLFVTKNAERINNLCLYRTYANLKPSTNDRDKYSMEFLKKMKATFQSFGVNFVNLGMPNGVKISKFAREMVLCKW